MGGKSVPINGTNKDVIVVGNGYIASSTFAAVPGSDFEGLDPNKTYLADAQLSFQNRRHELLIPKADGNWRQDSIDKATISVKFKLKE